MFDGFALDTIDAGDVTLRVRHGGSGPPLVLLHGHPRTHATWHRVGPLLADAGFTVVCPDLRGYGRSTVPPDEPGHAQASKRAMARESSRSWTRWASQVSASRRAATTAARSSRSGPRWTTPTASASWWSWTGCRAAH